MEILIPSTFGSEERDPKLIAFKIGQIARACGIFGVKKIIIYRDSDEKVNTKLTSVRIEKFLKYLECPPYLRKLLIPYDKDLREANVLSPLQIPAHGYSETYREGVVLKNQNPSIVEAGFKNPVEINQNLKKGSRVTLEKTDLGFKLAEKIHGFWTFKIENIDLDLKTILQEKRKEKKIIIGTSKIGEKISKVKSQIKKLDFENVVLVFGCAWRGVQEILKNCNVSESELKTYFDFIINLVPEQHTKTVRTEEALIIGLGLFNSWK